MPPARADIEWIHYQYWNMFQSICNDRNAGFLSGCPYSMNEGPR